MVYFARDPSQERAVSSMLVIQGIIVTAVRKQEDAGHGTGRTEDLLKTVTSNPQQ